MNKYMQGLLDPSNSQALLALGAGLLSEGPTTGDRWSRGLLGMNQAVQQQQVMDMRGQQMKMQQAQIDAAQRAAEREQQQREMLRGMILGGEQSGDYRGLLSQGEVFGQNDPILQQQGMSGTQRVPGLIDEVQDPRQRRLLEIAAVTGDMDMLQEALKGTGLSEMKDVLNQESKLRGEYIKQSGEFVKVRDSFGRVLASAREPSAAGDLALIFNFMKILDPGSVVREGEFANAQNAGGVNQRVRSLYNNVISGERLTPEQRQDFLKQAQSLYGQQLQGQESLINTYRGLAERSGVDPSQVVIDYTGGIDLNMPAQPNPNPSNPIPAYPGASGQNPARQDVNAFGDQMAEELKAQGVPPAEIERRVTEAIRNRFGGR